MFDKARKENKWLDEALKKNIDDVVKDWKYAQVFSDLWLIWKKLRIKSSKRN